MSLHNKPKKAHSTGIVPEDYICTENDIALIESVKSNSSGDELLVEIDHALVYRRDLQCLFQRNEYLNDAVVSAYIRLLRTKDNLRCRTGGKVYLEDPFISSILKRDGNPKIAINPKCDTMQKTVDNYLDNDMVFIPINIKETHWYLAVVNAKKCEIQVLDSLDCALGLEDLTTTRKGLQRYINIASLFKELKGHKWPSLQVATWPVTKIFEEKLQKDSASCGLFMLKYMEYWTGDMLSDEITQDDMTKFRPKLGAILLSSKQNKKGRSLVQPINEAKECSDDFVMLSSPKQVSAQTVMKTKTMIAAVQVAAQRSKRATRNTTTTVEAVQAMSAELVTTMEEANEMLAKAEAAKAVTEATVASDAAAMDEAVPVLEAEATADEAVPEAEATTDEATGAAITVVQKGKDNNETDELLLSSVQKKIVNIQPRQPPSDSMENGHPQTLARRAPCEYYEPENKVLGIRTLGDPQDTVGTSMEVFDYFKKAVFDSLFVSSMSSENSVEESSFRQLQDAVTVSQLDVQIKLCIRDGLYRLARSAQHRQVSPSTMNSNGNSQDTKDMQNAETWHKFDRCIALLLFHQSPTNIAGAVDDASSLKCHKKQHQSPAKNQDSSIQSPGGQDWSIFPDDRLPFMFPDEWMEFLHLD